MQWVRKHIHREAYGQLPHMQVLGIEQFSNVAHDKGSSHGSSRIIRLQYHEHPDYVPLLHRAYKLWRDLEADSGKVSNHMDLQSRFFCHG